MSSGQITFQELIQEFLELAQNYAEECSALEHKKFEPIFIAETLDELREALPRLRDGAYNEVADNITPGLNAMTWAASVFDADSLVSGHLVSCMQLNRNPDTAEREEHGKELVMVEAIKRFAHELNKEAERQFQASLATQLDDYHRPARTPSHRLL